MYKYRYVKVNHNGKCFYAHERSFLGMFKRYLRNDKHKVTYESRLFNPEGYPYLEHQFDSVKQIDSFLKERQLFTANIEYIEPTSLEKFLDGEE